MLQGFAQSRLFIHVLKLLGTGSNLTRHENFHRKFSLCAEYLIRSIGQKLACMLKVFTDNSEVII